MFVEEGKPWLRCWIWVPHYTCNNSLRIQSVTAVLCHISQCRKEKKTVDPPLRVVLFQRIKWQIIGHLLIAVNESWNDLLPLQQKVGSDDDGALWSVKLRGEKGRRGWGRGGSEETGGRKVKRARKHREKEKNLKQGKKYEKRTRREQWPGREKWKKE